MLGNNRGSGRTHSQMVNAPKGAVFIWCNNILSGARHIAENANRPDLEIVPESILEYPDRLRGRNLSGIIVDHYLYERLTGDQFRVLNMLILSCVGREYIMHPPNVVTGPATKTPGEIAVEQQWDAVMDWIFIHTKISPRALQGLVTGWCKRHKHPATMVPPLK